MLHSILFYVFAAIMFGAALGVVLSRNPVHSVMLLVFTFFNAAILWLLAEAEFLAGSWKRSLGRIYLGKWVPKILCEGGVNFIKREGNMLVTGAAPLINTN